MPVGDILPPAKAVRSAEFAGWTEHEVMEGDASLCQSRMRPPCETKKWVLVIRGLRCLGAASRVQDYRYSMGATYRTRRGEAACRWGYEERAYVEFALNPRKPLLLMASWWSWWRTSCIWGNSWTTVSEATVPTVMVDGVDAAGEYGKVDERLEGCVVACMTVNIIHRNEIEWSGEVIDSVSKWDSISTYNPRIS